MKSGAYPVVIKNTAMADLLATFCGVFSADNAQKGLSLLAGREGEAVASASVTLTDDPLMPMGLASCPFDREGAATKTKAVIEDGVLKTLLHNRKTAKAGCRTTGNAAGAGRVAPTNLFFQTRKADAGRAARQPRRRPVSDRGIRPARGREPHQRRLFAALPRV